MIAKRIAGATHDLGPPAGWSDEECGHLWVKAHNDGPAGVRFESAWEPTPRELEVLNAGGHVVLSVLGGQPPVSLYVTPATNEEAG